MMIFVSLATMDWSLVYVTGETKKIRGLIYRDQLSRTRMTRLKMNENILKNS